MWKVIYGWTNDALYIDVFSEWEDAENDAGFEFQEAKDAPGHAGEHFIVTIVNPHGLATYTRYYEAEY